MKNINLKSLVKNVGTLSILSFLIATFGMIASAQCGGSFTSMAAAAAAIQDRTSSSPAPAQSKSAAADDTTDKNDGNRSIVGLWHVRFVVGGQTIQEAYQIWNEGGTEVHNPNQDPRGGSVCLGAWKAAPQHKFKLNHRVWNYDTSGVFQGTINLTEILTINNSGGGHAGTFRLAFYNATGDFMFEVPGNVVAERITVD